jgi:hypothetical protein
MKIAESRRQAGVQVAMLALQLTERDVLQGMLQGGL